MMGVCLLLGFGLFVFTSVVHRYLTEFSRKITVEDKFIIQCHKRGVPMITDTHNNNYRAGTISIWTYIRKGGTYDIIAYGLEIPSRDVYPEIVSVEKS